MQFFQKQQYESYDVQTNNKKQYAHHSMATANLKKKLGLGDKYHRSIKVHT